MLATLGLFKKYDCYGVSNTHLLLVSCLNSKRSINNIDIFHFFAVYRIIRRKILLYTWVEVTGLIVFSFSLEERTLEVISKIVVEDFDDEVVKT